MTDVTNSERMRLTLADCNGQYWLAEGEEHLDALLVGELPPGISIDIVPCGSRAELFALWEKRSGGTAETSQPWVLNPRLMAGVLARLGLSRRVVQFSAWSAAMDQAAEAVISGAAAWLGENSGGALVLRQFLPEAAPPGTADLQRLRAQLVRSALERAGVPDVALRDETVAPEDMAQAEQLLIVTVFPAS